MCVCVVGRGCKSDRDACHVIKLQKIDDVFSLGRDQPASRRIECCATIGEGTMRHGSRREGSTSLGHLRHDIHLPADKSLAA